METKNLQIALLEKLLPRLGVTFENVHYELGRIEDQHTKPEFCGLSKDKYGRVEVKRVNAYVSDDYKEIMLVRDIHNGVTPMFLLSPETKEMLKSCAYFLPQDEEIINAAQFEFYRPTFEEAKKLSKPLREHYNQGGLILRKIGSKEMKTIKPKW